MENFATSFRPKTIEDFCGQEHLTSQKSPFYKLLKSKKIPHSLFYGPPGSGKTTMAKIIANELGLPFYDLDATSLKVEEFRKIFSKHKDSLVKPLIFVDEVHRLSKTQQEVLLIPMERSQGIIIGASTENPYFTLSSGIRSRSMLFEFKNLQKKDLQNIIKQVKEKISFEIDEDAQEYLINSSAGDSRAMLNLLEFAYNVNKSISIKTLRSLRPSALKDGVSSSDTHYDLASAMIKSIRGSDIDASIYYLARLIDGGESPDFIARRLVILASEDIGNANPNALNLAANTLSAVSKIGYPESRIILSQCVIYLASSPKSNSAYTAINKALKFVEENEKFEVPKHLKSPNPQGYLYPHDHGGWIAQKYTEKDVKFYDNKGIGYEKTLNEWIKKIKDKK